MHIQIITLFSKQTKFLLAIFSTFLCLFIISCRETPEERFQRLDKAGTEYFIMQDYQNAIENWTQLVKLQPDSAITYKKIGDCYLKLASYHNALQAFYSALQYQPENWNIWLQVAKIELNFMNFETAKQIWEVIKQHLATKDTAFFYGDLLIAQKKYPEATQEFTNVSDKNPENQAALSRLLLCFLGQNKNDDAKKIYAKLEALENLTPDTLRRISKYWLLIGNPKKAKIFIQKTIQLAPANYQLKTELAQFLIETNDYEEGIKLLQKLLLIAPDNRYVKKILIEALLLSNKNSDARTLLNTLSDAEGKDPDFSILKGKFFLNNFEYHDATSQFQKVIEQEPDHPLAYYLLAISYLAGGQTKLGQKSLIKSLTLNPNFTEAELSLASLYYLEENYRLAIEHTKRIINREPENYRGHLIMGNIYLAQKKYTDAIYKYDTARILNSRILAPLYYKAIALQHNGDSNSALQILNELRKHEPKLMDVLMQYAKFAVSAGEKEETILSLQNSLEKNVPSAFVFYILGETYYHTGEITKAMRAFSQALIADPRMKSARTKLIHIQSQQGIIPKEVLLKAIAEIDNFIEAQIELAKLYVESGFYQYAITLLEEALSYNPEEPQLANNLAWLYITYQPENINEAMRLAQLSYEHLPDNAATADTLGWVYYKKSMYTRASWLLEQARDLEPQNPTVLFHLGMTLKKQKKNKKALENLNLAIKLNLQQPSLEKAQIALEELLRL